MYFNLLSTVIILVILCLYNILTCKLILCRPEVASSCSHLMARYGQLGWGRVQIVFMFFLLGDCNAPCTLKTLYVELKKQRRIIAATNVYIFRPFVSLLFQWQSKVVILVGQFVIPFGQLTPGPTPSFLHIFLYYCTWSRRPDIAKIPLAGH